ncbi:hypothetical protein AAG570_003647 [Ranatra chinensis]|uniref:Uncharacterized protein n=1 Tax=Ranatra chinensis TaxID=642074 RepID=A0ABD0YIN8_9HEMI
MAEWETEYVGQEAGGPRWRSLQFWRRDDEEVVEMAAAPLVLSHAVLQRHQQRVHVLETFEFALVYFLDYSSGNTRKKNIKRNAEKHGLTTNEINYDVNVDRPLRHSGRFIIRAQIGGVTPCSPLITVTRVPYPRVMPRGPWPKPELEDLSSPNITVRKLELENFWTATESVRIRPVTGRHTTPQGRKGSGDTSTPPRAKISNADIVRSVAVSFYEEEISDGGAYIGYQVGCRLLV